jgi:hypothetical protein
LLGLLLLFVHTVFFPSLTRIAQGGPTWTNTGPRRPNRGLNDGAMLFREQSCLFLGMRFHRRSKVCHGLVVQSCQSWFLRWSLPSYPGNGSHTRHHRPNDPAHREWEGHTVRVVPRRGLERNQPSRSVFLRCVQCHPIKRTKMVVRVCCLRHDAATHVIIDPSGVIAMNRLVLMCVDGSGRHGAARYAKLTKKNLLFGASSSHRLCVGSRSFSSHLTTTLEGERGRERHISVFVAVYVPPAGESHSGNRPFAPR